MSDQKKAKFIRIADITATKSLESEIKDYLHDSGIKLMANVYAGKDVQEITLRKGDKILVSFTKGKYDKEFVLGNLSLIEKD
jgi:quinolinate synthase